MQSNGSTLETQLEQADGKADGNTINVLCVLEYGDFMSMNEFVMH